MSLNSSDSQNDSSGTLPAVTTAGVNDVTGIESFLSHPFFEHYVWLVPLRVVTGAATLFLNVATVIALGMSRHMQPGQRAGLINLSITGAVGGVTSIYQALAVVLILGGGVECDVRYSLVTLIIVASNLTLVMMSADRALSLWFPYKYTDFLTPFKLTVWALANWMVAALVTALGTPHTDARAVCNFMSGIPKAKFAAISGLGFIFAFGILTFHGVVYISALKQIRRIVPLGTQGGETTSAFRKLQPGIKATVTTAMLLVPYVICTAPLFSVAGYLAAHEEERVLPRFFFTVDLCQAVLFLNCLFNPIIYIWRLRQVRKTLLAILFRGRRPNPEEAAATRANGSPTLST